MVRKHVVDDIVTTVINDGDGSLCGMSYQQRCDSAEYGIGKFRMACQKYGQAGRSDLGESPALRLEVIEAASVVQEYYREHVAERKIYRRVLYTCPKCGFNGELGDGNFMDPPICDDCRRG